MQVKRHESIRSEVNPQMVILTAEEFYLKDRLKGQGYQIIQALKLHSVLAY